MSDSAWSLFDNWQCRAMDWNVKEDLLARFSKVRVVATDEAALRKVEEQLAKAGLIVPKRINVVLCDQFVRAA